MVPALTSFSYTDLTPALEVRMDLARNHHNINRTMRTA
jgi:hypothetical protein